MNHGDCYLYIESDSLVYFMNRTTLKATLIHVNAATIHLDTTSRLDANGTANKPGKGHYNASTSNGQTTIYGASNAG